MTIRDTAPDDVPAVRTVVAAAFARPDEAALVERLAADGDAAISLVAEDGGRIVGHILFSRVSAPFPALALAPVAVAPDRQHTGIGTALIRIGLERASRDGWRGVFVLGDPAYYQRFGFDAEAAREFDCPYAGPYLMALGLGGPMPARTGTLSYAAAFAALS